MNEILTEWRTDEDEKFGQRFCYCAIFVFISNWMHHIKSAIFGAGNSIEIDSLMFRMKILEVSEARNSEKQIFTQKPFQFTVKIVHHLTKCIFVFTNEK